jgi:nucleotide-binding universal stress UspA family protein
MSLVVGYDGGETSQAALTQAIALATALGEPLVVVAGVGPSGSLGEEYGEVEDALVEELEPVVLEGVARARAAGVSAEPMLVDAAPADALVTAAVNHSARMIIVGYGAAGRIRAALFGAVAHQVLDESDIPVLVVP